MVKHIVMFRLKGDVSQRIEAASRFRDALMHLPEIIEPLVDMEVGINQNPAESWDVVLTASLPSLDDVETYASHPAHLAAAAIISPLKEQRACVDYVV